MRRRGTGTSDSKKEAVADQEVPNRLCDHSEEGFIRAVGQSEYHPNCGPVYLLGISYRLDRHAISSAVSYVIEREQWASVTCRSGMGYDA